MEMNRQCYCVVIKLAYFVEVEKYETLILSKYLFIYFIFTVMRQNSSRTMLKHYKTL